MPAFRQAGVRYTKYALTKRRRNSATQISARETGHISTPRLHTLRRFHLEPINLVIS